MGHEVGSPAHGHEVLFDLVNDELKQAIAAAVWLEQLIAFEGLDPFGTGHAKGLFPCEQRVEDDAQVVGALVELQVYFPFSTQVHLILAVDRDAVLKDVGSGQEGDLQGGRLCMLFEQGIEVADPGPGNEFGFLVGDLDSHSELNGGRSFFPFRGAGLLLSAVGTIGLFVRLQAA